MTSTLLTPVDSGPVLNLAETSEGLEFDKHILPEGRSITYKGREVLFDRALATDLVESFSKPLPVLLDGPLAHDVQDRDTGALRDPERWRGDVVGLRLAQEGEEPGLYGRVRFPNADAAKAVLANGKLGVSARILEGIAEGGRKAGRVMQHLLMTMVPRVDGLSPWKAVNLASSDDGDVIDLTEAEYDDEEDASVADDEEITDEEINRALADAAAELEDEPVTVELSREDRDTIDLAVSRAEEAERNAQAALTELAQERWRGDRLQYAQAGVPAADLDLAGPLLSLPGSQVIDLAEGDPVDPCEIVRKLLDNRKGTIDLSKPQGYGGEDDTPEILNPNGEHGDPRAKVGSAVWPA